MPELQGWLWSETRAQQRIQSKKAMTCVKVRTKLSFRQMQDYECIRDKINECSDRFLRLKGYFTRTMNIEVLTNIRDNYFETVVVDAILCDYTPEELVINLCDELNVMELYK